VALGPKGTSHFGFSLAFSPAFYWTLCLVLLFIFNGWPSLIPLLFRSRGLLIFAPAKAPQVARNSGFVAAANLVKKILVLLTFGLLNKPPGENAKSFEQKRKYHLIMNCISFCRKARTTSNFNLAGASPKKVCYGFRRKVTLFYLLRFWRIFT